MKILLTGATGYIGQRLLPSLIAEGHTVVCCTRDLNRFHTLAPLRELMEVIEVDFLDTSTLGRIPKDIDAAYYLMHSMSSSTDYSELEKQSARNFRECINETNANHVIYLSGIVNDSSLSEHLASRKAVEVELGKGRFHLTTLRAGIIIGSGSASYEIIRDLVEKLPIMIAPKWLLTRCQPIGIRDVITFLTKSLGDVRTFDKHFDIAGPDILTYRQILLGFAKVRGLKRWIITVPVMTPRLSSYWLYFVTSTSYKLATSLVDSMKVEVVAQNHEINDILQVEPIGYEEAIKRTLQMIEQNQVVSSWKDSLVSGRFRGNISVFLQVPQHGCYVDKRSRSIKDEQIVRDRIWRIGGNNGWYSADVLWRLRGYMDKLFGGVGLRRGRTHAEQLNAGDALDFWRVLYADKTEGRLLLFAEMRLPGEAWLEFLIKDGVLHQTATFRPKGLAGRLYWYSVLPFHGLVFSGMLKKLTA